METIKHYTETFVALLGITGDAVPYVTHVCYVLATVVAALLAWWLCRRLFVPAILKVTHRTEPKWDEVLFNEHVLRSATNIVPAVIVWQLLPLAFFEHPTVREALTRLTAIYITVMMVRTIIAFINSFRLLEGEHRSARQQYFYTLSSVLKIIMIFITVVVVIAIITDKDPSTLFAGLGAASAILMLAFQDTIKGLVAGIRLTSNDMLHKGDWITVPSAGANGRVEEISLTMVKVRNFDNTVVTVTPQTLVDGSFQNWLTMEQGDGRKQTRQISFDFRSVTLLSDADKQRLVDDGLATADELQGDVANVTAYRLHIERWLQQQPEVVSDRVVLVRQAEATQAGMCLEFMFWLIPKYGADYEHATSRLVEYFFAAAPRFGLRVYQQFPQQ